MLANTQEAIEITHLHTVYMLMYLHLNTALHGVHAWVSAHKWPHTHFTFACMHTQTVTQSTQAADFTHTHKWIQIIHTAFIHTFVCLLLFVTFSKHTFVPIQTHTPRTHTGFFKASYLRRRCCRVSRRRYNLRHIYITYITLLCWRPSKYSSSSRSLFIFTAWLI